LFHVIDKICNAARNNFVAIKMLNNFVRCLIKGIYASQRNGKYSGLIFEHGDLIKSIQTGNRFVDQAKRNNDSRYEDISSDMVI